MATDRFPIESGHILMFARSIGDPNPAYTGDGALAPPTFVQAGAQFDEDYILRPKIGQPWFGSGRNATSVPPSGEGGGGIGSGLHAEQHYTYHRPLKAGMVLTATSRPGETWEKQGRRGGKLVFSEGISEYTDQDGNLVVTARSVGVRTEKTVEQGS